MAGSLPPQGVFDLDAWTALAFAQVVVPSWVEERGCVILARQYDAASFQTWWESTDGDRRAVEAVLNHVHLWDLLPNTDETDYVSLWNLGELMVSSWAQSLERSFPEQTFTVTLDDEYGPSDLRLITPLLQTVVSRAIRGPVAGARRRSRLR